MSERIQDTKADRPAPAGIAAPHHLGGGVIFAKLFPNPDEPYRGIFVADQMAATAARVDWSVVAPAPWVPRRVARLLGKPWVKGTATYRGHPVAYPRYPVLPRRIGYATVAPLIARTARDAFRRACASVDARFVHVHDLYPTGPAGRRLSDEAGLPYVLTVHGLDLYSNLSNPRWRRQIRYAALGAGAIVCVGERLARDCIAHLGVDPGRVFVIPNTYDVERFRFVERPIRRDPVRLVTLGRLSSEKGHDVLLRAVGQVLASGVDVSLTVVGDGPERSTLEALASELDLGAHISFTGTLLGTDVPDAFAQADAFVLPSRQEGFGVALIEAMATGLPVVATRSGGPEGIVGPADGLLVAPGDVASLAEGILALLQSLDSYDGNAIAARTAQRYSPEAVGERLTTLYAEVLAGGPISSTLARGTSDG
ncbi:MAG: glycosyltransferase [Coriobacteriia bacterium]|nr:glycosyltransferase [Coriobacteriia bacterium]